MHGVASELCRPPNAGPPMSTMHTTMQTTIQSAMHTIPVVHTSGAYQRNPHATTCNPMRTDTDAIRATRTTSHPDPWRRLRQR